MAEWATRDDVRLRWSDAPLDDELLQSMLDAAQDQAEQYAPPITTPGVPARYKEAVVLQVRELWNSQERDGDVLGYGDGYAVRVRPLGQAVKSLLRPKRALGAIG